MPPVEKKSRLSKVAVLPSETPRVTQVPFGASMPSAAPSAEAPTESTISQNGPCGFAAERSGPSTTRPSHHPATASRYSARRTWPQTCAPAAAASWQARCPTPPEAPSTSTLRPSSSPPWRSACKAVRPATGNVAACASLHPSGSTATACERQLTRSAQAPDGRMPTTRAPDFGPLPSAASRSTTPAKSQPGRQPGAASCNARLVSPRLSEIAVTLTCTSSRSGSRNSAGRIASFPCASGSTTTARICVGIGSPPIAAALPRFIRPARSRDRPRPPRQTSADRRAGWRGRRGACAPEGGRGQALSAL